MTKNKKILMDFFIENPSKRLRVRQIEKETGIVLPSVVRYTKELVSEDFLKKEKISGVTFFRAKTESEKYILTKKFHNIRRLYDSGLVKHLRQEYFNGPIILFGSFAKGVDSEDSDIDIFVSIKGKKIPRLDKFEKELGKSIQILTGEFKKIPNKHLANNIVNGVVLNGFLEVF